MAACLEYILGRELPGSGPDDLSVDEVGQAGWAGMNEGENKSRREEERRGHRTDPTDRTHPTDEKHDHYWPERTENLATRGERGERSQRGEQK